MCNECPIKEPSGENACWTWVLSHPDEGIEIVRKWSEEHPKKTRKSEFLKMFPNARRDVVGNPLGCPRYFDGNKLCLMNGCQNCSNNYWNEPVDDE